MYETAHAPTAVYNSGSGPPLICLHAIGHSARDFLGLAARYGDQFSVTAFDWPGHGESPADGQTTSLLHYGDILANYLRDADLSNAILLGNSIGGAAALVAASKEPSRVRALVLCNSAGLMPVNLMSKIYCRVMAARFAAGEQGKPGFQAWFRRYYEKSILTEIAAAERREEIIASGYEVAGVLRQAWLSFTDPGSDIRHIAAELPQPVLYAWARKDKAVSLSRCRKAISATPNHRLVTFDASHTPFLEQPEAFFESFDKFLKTLPH